MIYLSSDEVEEILGIQPSKRVTLEDEIFDYADSHNCIVISVGNKYYYSLPTLMDWMQNRNPARYRHLVFEASMSRISNNEQEIKDLYSLPGARKLKL